MRERFEQVDTQIRQVGVQVEDVRSDVAQVAESVSNVDEKLGRHVRDNEEQFNDVRATIQISHALLMKRDDALDARLTILESASR
jgi:glutaredoxin-related protein